MCGHPPPHALPRLRSRHGAAPHRPGPQRDGLSRRPAARLPGRSTAAHIPARLRATAWRGRHARTATHAQTRVWACCCRARSPWPPSSRPVLSSESCYPVPFAGNTRSFAGTGTALRTTGTVISPKNQDQEKPSRGAPTSGLYVTASISTSVRTVGAEASADLRLRQDWSCPPQGPVLTAGKGAPLLSWPWAPAGRPTGRLRLAAPSPGPEDTEQSQAWPERP